MKCSARTHLFICLAILLTSLSARAQPLPRAEAVPGGIAIVQLSEDLQAPAPKVTYRERRVMVLKTAAGWHGVVGIPLAADPGQQSLTVDWGNGKASKLTFNVANKDYETQHLTIKNKRKVDPTAEDLKRIGKEKQIINGAFARWTDLEEVPAQFVVPVQGRMSSSFGLRRFFNEQPRKPHSGLDIAAPEGAPIVAPAAGRVVATGNFFFNGQSVFLDHGQGLISMYCHMSRIDVKEGQEVGQGESIGAVGMTGRVTGPHLHWSVSLNNTRVDPLLFFSDAVLARLKLPTP